MDYYLQEMGFLLLCILISHLHQMMPLCPGGGTQTQELPWGLLQQTHRNHLKNLQKNKQNKNTSCDKTMRKSLMQTNKLL